MMHRGIAEQMEAAGRTPEWAHDSTGDSVGHPRTLSTLWIVYGVLSIAAAVGMLIYSGTATAMFGALLNRAPNPFMLMGMFHAVYALVAAAMAACGILGILAGVAMFAGTHGRPLAIVASFLALIGFPLGTMLGVYTLIVLLR